MHRKDLDFEQKMPIFEVLMLAGECFGLKYKEGKLFMIKVISNIIPTGILRNKNMDILIVIPSIKLIPGFLGSQKEHIEI